eukprot:gene19095-25697_t
MIYDTGSRLFLKHIVRVWRVKDIASAINLHLQSDRRGWLTIQMQGSAPISAGITTIQKARDECVASIATLTAAHSSEIVTLWKKVDRLDQAARAGMTILLEDDNVDDWFAVAASVNVTMRYLRLKSIDQMVEEMLNSHPTDPPSSSLSMPLLTFGLTVSFFKAVACDPYEKYIRVLRSFTTNDAAVVEAQQVFGIRLTAMELFDQYDVSFLKVGDVEKDATDA